MDLNSLLILSCIVRWGSFAEASRQLNIPTSSISRRIQLLEASLDTRLLNRTTRALTLTESGKAILNEIEHIQLASDRIQAIALDQLSTPRGKITLTAPQGFINWPLGQWILEFKKKYPTVDMELIAGNRFLDLQKEGIDFAFRQGPLPDSRLIAKKITDIQYGLFASTKLLDEAPSINSIHCLSTLPAICVSAKGKQIPWQLENAHEKTTLLPKSALTVEDTNLVQQAVLSDLGVGYLALVNMEDALINNLVKPVLKDWWPSTVGFYLVYQSKDLLPAKDSVFLKFIEEKIETTKLKA